MYRRTGPRFRDANTGVEGIRGEIVIGDLSWPTVVRGDGYKHLPPGPYACEMGYWRSRDGSRAKAIRVLGDYSRGRIYIHPANWPHQLTGCIAPGLEATPDGVAQSRAATSSILDVLGGWKDGAPVKLEVV